MVLYIRATFLLAITACNTSHLKRRTIRKLMGGGAGEVQKKYLRKGKLNEKKFMHAN